MGENNAQKQVQIDLLANASYFGGNIEYLKYVVSNTTNICSQQQI